MKPLLIAEKISKSFKAPTPLTVFDQISLTLNRGESVAITGRSGEGKTTLLHILGSLEFPDQGSVQIDGITATPETAPLLRREKVGFIFQSFYLLEDLSAIDNVLLPSRIARNPQPRSYGLRLLDQVGLAHLADRPTHLLSGGEKQRVTIARALCNNPSLILADEPSGNLDSETSQIIADLLFNLAHQEHKALLLVTHEPSLAARCSRTLRLESKHLF